MPGLDSQNVDDFYNNYVVPGESPDHEAAPPQDNQPPDFSRLYNPIHDAIAGIGDSVGGASDAAGGMLTPDGPTVRFGAPPPNLPQSQNRSAGVSTSEGSTAINLDTFGQMETKGHRGIDATLVRAKNETNAEFAPFAENAMAASENQRKAIGQETAAVTAKNDADAKFQQDIATRMKQNAADDERDYALAQVKTQAYMADYEKSINQLASMTVNPGRAYSELSGNARAGIKVTAFITDFLGAKGIKTSGMDYINRGIDMDIQAQKDAINLQKDVTQGKQNLWQMQRQQSESDYEATVRTRGALLNAFKTEIAGKLAAFDSPIARAKAAEASAAVDQELVKTLTTLKQLADNSYQAKAQNAVSIRGQDVTASIASADRAQRAQFREEDKRAAQIAALAPDEKNAMYNTRGEPMGFISPNDDYKKVAESIVAVDGVSNLLRDYADGVKAAGKQYGGPLSRAFEDHVNVLRDSLQGQLAAAIARANNPDGRISDSDINEAKHILHAPNLIDGIFAGDDPTDAAVRVAGDYGKRVIQNHRNYLNVHLRKMTDAEAKQLRPGGPRDGTIKNIEANADYFDVTAAGKKPELTPVDKLVAQINVPGSKGGKASVDASVNPTLIEAARAIGIINEKAEEPETRSGPGGIYVKRGKPAVSTVPSWAKSMDGLFNTALNGSTSDVIVDSETKESTTSADYNKHRQQAVDNLKNIAFRGDDKLKSALAMYYLSELSNKNHYGKLVTELDVPTDLDPNVVNAIINKKYFND